MFSSLNKFMFKVSLIVFFIAAISLFLVMDNNTNELLELVERSYINGDGIIVKSYNEIDKKYKGYEIISKIIFGMEYDIEIDGNNIEKDIDYKIMDFSIINEDGIYILSLDIDSSGKIIKEIYKEKLWGNH